MNELELRIENLIKDIIETEMGFELVGVEVKRGRTQLIRVYIDRPAGVDIEMCADVSRRVGKIIEEQDVLEGFYSLEVSSPGIERLLRKPADYVRFKGKNVLVKTKEPKDGRKRFKGKLTDVHNDGFVVEADKQEIYLKYDEVLQANIVFDFKTK